MHPFSPFCSPNFAHHFPAHPVENTVPHSLFICQCPGARLLRPFHTSGTKAPGCPFCAFPASVLLEIRTYHLYQSCSRTSGREHRSALSFHLSMSRRPSPPAVPYVRYKRSVPPCLCSPGVRLARPAKRTDTRSAHFSLCFLDFFFCICVRSDIVSIRQPLSTSHLSRRCDWVRAWFPPVARRRMVVWCLWGTMEMGIEKAPSRFDLTLLCDSFSCTICLLWVEIVLVHC